MKTSIDYGLMLVFLACLFACCACEEAKDEKFLLRGGASSTIEKSLPDSVPTIGNTLSLNRNNEKVNSILAEGKAVTIRDVTKGEDMARNDHLIIAVHDVISTERMLPVPVVVKIVVVVACLLFPPFTADAPDSDDRRFLSGRGLTDPGSVVEVQLEDGTVLKTCIVGELCDSSGLSCPLESCPMCPPTPAPTPSPTCYKDPSDPQACDDPHLWTWEGKMYDYHGQCDLIYTTCPKFDDSKGLHLHLRTQFVEPNMWSTISSIAIKIGEDVLEVQNNGNYYVNGEPNVLLTDTTNLSDHALSQQLDKDGSRTIYKIDLKDNVSLYIKVRRLVERDSLSFTIKGVHNHRKNGGTSFDDCEGLSSTWEHPGGERFLVGRSGTHYAKHEAVDFGPEWQVDFTKNDPSLFYEDIGHQLPHQECIDSPLQAKDQRHLKALHEVEGGALARQAEEACGHLDGGGDLFDACFFDVLVTGDVTFAQEPWYNEGE